MVNLILLFLWPFLFGLNGMEFIPADQEAMVVVYRKPSGMFKKIELRVEGKKTIPSIKPNTYYEIRMDPGKVLLETKGDVFTEHKEYSITLAGGQVYYLEAVLEYQAFNITMHLVRKSEETAKKAIQEMKKEQVKW